MLVFCARYKSYYDSYDDYVSMICTLLRMFLCIKMWCCLYLQLKKHHPILYYYHRCYYYYCLTKTDCLNDMPCSTLLPVQCCNNVVTKCHQPFQEKFSNGFICLNVVSSIDWNYLCNNNSILLTINCSGEYHIT